MNHDWINANPRTLLQAARTPEAAALLKAARNVIASPSHWTQYASARDAHGIGTASLIDARSYCILGAIGRAHYDLHRQADEFQLATSKPYLDAIAIMASVVYRERPEASEELSPYARISEFNDAANTAHSNALAAFDRAIALAEPG